jgi:diguanylate cyclase (GGDEF)-like protein
VALLSTDTRAAALRGGRDADAVAASRAARYRDALCTADGAGAQRVIDEALAAALAPAAIHALVIEPAMVAVGELWAAGTLTVADEHLATAISQRVLVTLFDRLCVARAGSRERILLAAVEGQRHTLGLRMIADVLEGAGFDVLYLGGDVPVAALSRFAADHQPAVAGLGAAAGGVDALRASIAAVHDASPATRIMLGGRAVPPSLAASGYPIAAGSMDVLATVEQLLRLPSQSAYMTLCPPAPRLSEVRPPQEGALVAEPAVEQMADVARDASDTAREFVRRARLFKDLAFRDPVTDLGNRRAFDDRLHSATRHGGADSALLMIDVDRFKVVNDTHGHEEGDRVLRLVGSAITRSIRAHDFAARVGGDEFAVLLGHADAEDAHHIAERIGRAVEQDTDLALTVSIGIAALCDDPRGTVLAADVALYDAKAAGRNRAVAAGEVSPDALR